jgi:hypothetical protein
MRLTNAPNPSPLARQYLTSIEPWQRDALARVSRHLGVDEDAILRAGLTVVLALIAVSERLPDQPARP